MWSRKKALEKVSKALRNGSRKVSMGMKLWGSYVIIILFFASITFVAYQNINQLNAQLHILGTSKVPGGELTGNLKEEVTSISLYTTKHAFEQNVEDKTKMAKNVRDDIINIRKNIAEMEKYANQPEDKKLLANFNANFKEYTAAIPMFIANSLTGNYDELHKQMEVLTPLGEKTNLSLDQLQKGIQKETQSIIVDSEQSSSKAINQMMIVSVILALFSILVAFLITRLIRRSVSGVVKNVDITTNSIAEIKKSIDKTVNGSGELDVSMNKANNSVSELVASIQQVAGNTSVTASSVDEISAAVEQMSASVNQVAGSANYLSASTEETSSAIQEMMASIEQVAANVHNAGAGVEQISAAIEEMSKSIKDVSEHSDDLTVQAEQASHTVDEMIVSIKQVADSAQTVNQLSNSVKNDALEGTNSLNETLNGMKEISQVITQTSDVMVRLGKRSEEIGSIIEVIDDIAEQTNLLALNAAIEAARAGDHGKGFAVVADEVRKLAERSAKATKEITVLINGIQDETATAVTSIQEESNKVEIGNQLANKTKQAIKKISDGIAQVTEEMNQIARATEDQTKNSEYITYTVENVTKRASEMTYSTKEQSVTAEEVVRGITNIKEQVQQISIATTKQEKEASAIVAAVENVANQSNSVTNATKEQALTSEEIVRNINSIKEMVQQMTIVTNKQAEYGQEIQLEVENVLKQTKDLNDSIETQSREVEEVVHSITEVNTQIDKIK
jgi:methyl-accepting chemotaxis protein